MGGAIWKDTGEVIWLDTEVVWLDAVTVLSLPLSITASVSKHDVTVSIDRHVVTVSKEMEITPE